MFGCSKVWHLCKKCLRCSHQYGCLAVFGRTVTYLLNFIIFETHKPDSDKWTVSEPVGQTQISVKFQSWCTWCLALLTMSLSTNIMTTSKVIVRKHIRVGVHLFIRQRYIIRAFVIFQIFFYCKQNSILRHRYLFQRGNISRPTLKIFSNLSLLFDMCFLFTADSVKLIVFAFDVIMCVWFANTDF